MTRAGTVLVLLLGGAACEGGSATAPEDVEPGRSFELEAGRTAVVAGAGLRVRFDAVTGDSRCPEGVQCVWEGDATVRLELEKPPEARQTRELHTSPRFETQTRYGDHTIVLEGLRPHPREGQALDPDDYVATLRVDRVEPTP